jgi:hypothetical protein
VIAEPDVALTDWGLAVECAILARLMACSGTREPALAHRVGARPWLVLFFGSTALAALLGGAVHGLFPDPASLGQRLLWPITLLAIGVTAWTAWAAGGHLAFGPAAGRAIAVLAGGAFVVYGVVAWRAGWPFVAAIADYLPAAVFLLAVFAWLYAKARDRGLLAGIGGLLLTFVAAGVQHEGIDLSPVYFDHNALNHVIQALALLLIYRGAAAALLIGGGR